MKTKSILALFLTVLSISSCNDKVEEKIDYITAWQTYYREASNNFCVNYINYNAFPFSQPVRLLFTMDSQWDEVTYNISNPSDFIITHYESKDYITTDSCESFIVLKDSIEIGNVKLLCDGKVLFEEKSTSIEYLLYDFKYICNNSIGTYEINLTSNGKGRFFLYSNATFLPEDALKMPIPTNGGSSYPLIEDEYGGYSIALFGSNSGFFSPIEKCKEGYKCEVLQAYNKYHKMSSIGIIPFYSNRESVISPFLSNDFWIRECYIPLSE